MNEDLQPCAVDFHCHLDLYSDHVAAVAMAEAARIFTLTVTTTPRAWPRNYEVTRNSRYVRAAIGLHPQLASQRADELALWDQYLPETQYVGEVGLDAGPRFYKSLDVQIRVFRHVLERCAEAGGKALTVHSVRSVPRVLDMVERYYPQDRGVVVLHWFTGSKRDAQRAASLGCYFSVNAEMTRSERGCSLLADLPSDRILTETDGPFTRTGERPSQPTDVHIAIEALARARKVSAESMADTIRMNLRTLHHRVTPWTDVTY